MGRMPLFFSFFCMFDGRAMDEVHLISGDGDCTSDDDDDEGFGCGKEFFFSRFVYFFG